MRGIAGIVVPDASRYAIIASGLVKPLLGPEAGGYYLMCLSVHPSRTDLGGYPS